MRQNWNLLQQRVNEHKKWLERITPFEYQMIALGQPTGHYMTPTQTSCTSIREIPQNYIKLPYII